MMVRNRNRFRQETIPSLLLVGDTAVAFGGLCLGYWLRYRTPVGSLGIDVPHARFSDYLPLLLLGVAFLIASYAHLNLYSERLFLRRYQSLNIIIKGSSFWLVAYLSLSLVLKFEPPISRLFVVIAYVTTVGLMYAWRLLFYRLISSPKLLPKIQLRVAILGWNASARALVSEIESSPAHPYRVCGLIRGPAETEEEVPPNLSELGQIECLEPVLRENRIDVLIAAGLDLAGGGVQRITEACESTYVEFKVVPSIFQIFLSGLKLQTIGTIPILGVEDLAVDRLFNRYVKRVMDVAGSVAGLVLSAPVIALAAVLIRRESPGPVFFSQRRIGANHRPFTLHKLRSMHCGAERYDAERQSTAADDPRLLRIGAWLRRWNIDELPQFWNVLKGDMSLIGPRPERPYHVSRLSGLIPHYLPRHLAKPGMTGWAQVNGLRGEGSLERRIQHDIYYIENWSFWLDVQILLMTFVRWKNPSE